jgi:putative ABC transport system ATP-binding protein
LLYAIAGLMDVMQGSIQVAGTDITKLSESERDRFRGKRIGMIFQTLHLVKSLSVMDNLMLASYVAGVPQYKEHAHGLLKQLGIYEKRDALPSQLSQGQAQRVAIVRAVLHHPELLLADEPTSSLDDGACEAVMTLIQKIAKDNGAALLVSTHDARVKKYFSEVITIGGAA